jgi:hypothetical protein
MGCGRDINDGDYCTGCQAANQVDYLGRPRLPEVNMSHEGWLEYANDPRFDEKPLPPPATTELTIELPDDDDEDIPF